MRILRLWHSTFAAVLVALTCATLYLSEVNPVTCLIAAVIGIGACFAVYLFADEPPFQEEGHTILSIPNES